MNAVASGIVRYSWRFPLARVLSGRRTVVCLYHGVPRRDSAVFEQHVSFLKRHFDLALPKDCGARRKRSDRIRVLLTFDDGFRNHAEVVAPILRRHKVAGVFFVPSRHATDGQYLWFSYLLALERHFNGNGFTFRGDFIAMAPGQRQQNIERLSNRLLALSPHPAAIYEAIERELPPLEDFVQPQDLIDGYAGMTPEQIGELASDPLFVIGAHTVDHPMLTRCSPDEAVRQIRDNKRWLEQITNQPCDAIAYPSGNYDAAVLSACRDLGFSRGYATTPLFGRDLEFEIPRMGIYSPSVETLGFKIHWGNSVRAVGMRIG